MEESITFTDGKNLTGLEKARLFIHLTQEESNRPTNDILDEIEKIDFDPTALSKVSSVLLSTFQFIASGASLVSEEEQSNRLSICNQCSHFDASAYLKTGSCKLCGCSIKIKIKAKTFSCPIGNW